MNSKSLLGAVILAAIFGAALYGSLYRWGSQSEAFQVAEQSIRSSQAVTEELGSVEAVSLDPFEGYRIRDLDSDASARMLIDVVGSRAKGAVRVSMQKAAGTWRVTGATIDGRALSLR